MKQIMSENPEADYSSVLRTLGGTMLKGVEIALEPAWYFLRQDRSCNGRNVQFILPTTRRNGSASARPRTSSPSWTQSPPTSGSRTSCRSTSAEWRTRRLYATWTS
ncbi:hypothetical protein HPB51_027586 [Rhipicephalus microplus]|uniref:Uncharacterized protein n=1 Tax=Rhipicephalus microplus TaxID=6941 RepID=A0A9J6CZQ2_RHIMP|nr:hypothetical protein HPB51_027586 [Rhipicephalus microplus]